MAAGVHFTGIEQAKKALGPQVVELAVNSALNKTINLGKTVVSKSVTSQYNIKAGFVKKRISIVRARRGRSVAILASGSPSLPLVMFDAQEIRLSGRGGRKVIKTKRYKDGFRSQSVNRTKRHQVGVTVRVKKGAGRKVVKGKHGFGGFIGQGQRGNQGGGFGRRLINLIGTKQGRGNIQIFERKKQSRLPLRAARTLSIAGMVGGQKSLDALVGSVEHRFPDLFEHEIEHRISKALAKAS